MCQAASCYRQACMEARFAESTVPHKHTRLRPVPAALLASENGLRRTARLNTPVPSLLCGGKAPSIVGSESPLICAALSRFSPSDSPGNVGGFSPPTLYQ